MKRILLVGILFGTIVLAGCSGISKYDDNEAAAIVKGQEITVGDLRFLYPDDTALDYLDSAIGVELIKQEVKEMNLDVSTNLSDEKNRDEFEKLPLENTKDEGGKQIRKYAIVQAKKLDMTPEDFQKEYAKKINEQNAYINAYLEEKLGGGDVNDSKWMDEFGEEYHKLLEKLIDENKDEIKVLID
ncbi:hypothetical protein A1A1_18915 [Planococcus antarcticus DSM 14505]|uniref:Uncharacterized protein n=1 Tax=Planococcus antarcticus DSM 14505 TaxID=1185653 RepID=A0A1C7DE25_9BACL|nr:hypothetical protein [Planococcus antarcticus]ANU09736.1 hypothetical protein BBH88_05205 [Planococcus antarcticus DSM 14505]EIM04926.1 hypothetical protein A1A1_18915 [Planococcus antarcticus DSM 14505]